MKKLLIWILIGMLFVSGNVFAHVEAEEGTENHDEIHYTFEEFYLPMIVVFSIIGMIIFNLKKLVSEELERS